MESCIIKTLGFVVSVRSPHQFIQFLIDQFIIGDKEKLTRIQLLAASYANDRYQSYMDMYTYMMIVYDMCIIYFTTHYHYHHHDQHFSFATLNPFLFTFLRKDHFARYVDFRELYSFLSFFLSLPLTMYLRMSFIISYNLEILMIQQLLFSPELIHFLCSSSKIL